MLTVKQAAAELSVSPSLIYALLKARRLPAVRIGCRGRGCWRIDPADLAAYREACRVQPAPDEGLVYLK